MPISAGTGLAIAGGAGLVGSGISAWGATNAAGKQADAAQQALALQQQEFQTAQNNLQPYLGIGGNAVNSINSLYGYGTGAGGANANPDFSQFTNSPDYAFAQQQGNLGVQRYLSATGLSASGGAMKDISSFNQGLASQQYGNYFSRLMGLAQLGNNAATASGQFASQAGAQMGNTIQGLGQAQASGIVGATNAIGGGLGNIGNMAFLSGLLGKSNQSAYTNPSLGSYASTNATAGQGLGQQ